MAERWLVLGLALAVVQAAQAFLTSQTLLLRSSGATIPAISEVKLSVFAVHRSTLGSLPRSPRLNLHGVRAAVAQDAGPLKAELLESIFELKRLQERDGKESVDFGVKGGELDSKTRAPRNLAEDDGFYKISEDVGKAADRVFGLVEQLEPLNPTPDISLNFQTEEGDKNPLHGRWQLLFSTAADATFSKNSTRGDAIVANEVDAKRGKVMNIIEFCPQEDGSPKAVDVLKVRLQAEILSEKRVGLTFKYVRARVRKLFGLPVRLPLFFPVPGPFLTRILYLFRKQKQIPRAYFDVLFLDSDLRIHKTGEGNLFIQARPEWEAAWKQQ
mmetsp:Transcript_13399/g.20958  ORF Transcript_13399/g.20958 Transcript_13399/m.20958 type:complete len:328 (-) Transcript_13399:506-1489(-)|eukprot:CAMPEP_0184322050 /NCGR_PEP_ID=MMETSP1049-20130417/122559_1 /TAXON_ID=77928 /ORGANISM="Proteomonas sulcata, Strain CCMP704" /LENGTH=327 /DNA_ID=CAMNT_0026643057 /DNA_START=121 /DNA_END=1104 /DNA_ORIENTATION=+